MKKKFEQYKAANLTLFNWVAKHLGRPLNAAARRLDALTILESVWLALIGLGITLNVISLVNGMTGNNLGLIGNAISGLILNALTVVLVWILTANRKRRAKELEGMHALGLALARVRAYEGRLAQQVHDNERAIYKATINTKRFPL